MNGFADRASAGSALAAELSGYRDREDVLVLGLPRGGVPVAAEVADALHAPLDLVLVRKLGAPGQPELAIGAIASGGVIVINENILSAAASAAEVQSEIARQRAELNRRDSLYRNGRLPLGVAGRRVILVDDGAATGATMLAAIRAVRKQNAKRVVVAIPVASIEALATLREEADEVICLLAPPTFLSVGDWYRHFEQTTDAEVCALLSRARTRCQHIAAPARASS
ncbi:MAG TPA: phosphoribosyltransferase [Steroidobacteraceae bacterium]|nr:phosphoribosyltransferase [Steroidobacteraceae bacterium]